jgi:probable F420-dependent oxidoreductase
VLPEIGLNLVPVAADRLVDAAVLAEQLGYESVWMGEHVLTPVDQQSAYPGRKLPFGYDSPFLDPIVALSHVAARTTTLRLGTGVLMLPVRDPFITARELASLDVLSGGRLEVGAGLGWMKEEYEILGRDWSTRGARLEEMITVITELFTADVAEHHGAHVEMPAMGFGPKPVQRPRPRLHLGGHTPRALRRAARMGDGWYGGSAAIDDITGHVAVLRREREAAGLDPDAFQMSMVLLHEPEPEELHRLAGCGLHRVVITPWRRPDGPAFPGEVGDLSRLAQLAELLELAPAARS